MNDQQIEDEIVAKDKTAPRVTPEHIQSLITGSITPRLKTGVNGNIHKQDELTRLAGYHGELKLLTFCVLVLKNGFTVTGESSCASPENFDEEIGRKITRQNAVNKIWMLEGYLLKEKLSEL
ncbi:Gp49 family protein [Enterobacter kobei]